MRRGRLCWIALALVAPLATVPPVTAHCDGTVGSILIVDKCQLNQNIEAVINELNDAGDGDIAYVMAKDKRWHPEVITINNGGTVVFVHLDIHSNDLHDPRSSGPCVNPAVDPVASPKACIPTVLGACFDVEDDQGHLLEDYGQQYPVTLRHISAEDLIQKSHGYRSGTMVGDVSGAQPFVGCPTGTAIHQSETRAVLPYHCGVHGGPSTPEKDMRGVIIIEGAF